MNGAAIVAGLAALALGGGLAVGRSTFRVGIVTQAAGCGLVALGGFWAFFARR